MINWPLIGAEVSSDLGLGFRPVISLFLVCASDLET